jgi:DNA polymerase (family 10)
MMQLIEAQNLASRIVKVFLSYCEKVEIAGSIRRQKLEPRDIDIVVIPKVTLGSWQQAILSLKRKFNAKVLKQGSKYVQLEIEGIGVDIYSVGEDNWGSVLLQRTGPWQFNEFLAKRAIRMGLRWTVDGIIKEGEVIAGKTEEDMFKALKMEYVEPKDRS